MKASICITVFNEEKTIDKLLNSLLNQTTKPDEIVIVDAGSIDTTAEQITDYQKLFSEKLTPLRLIISSGASIAVGRNISIKNAKHKIIVLIDSGCIAKKDWLKKITKPFENREVDFVAGFYHMTGDSSLQKAVAPLHGVPPERFDVNKFLPSARSMAFTKKVWQEVGGFNEKLERAGEDTLFNYKVLQKGFMMVRVKSAIVYWEVPKIFKESMQKFYIYAKGDAQAGIWWNPAQRLATHNLKILTIFIRYLIGLLFLILSFRYNSLSAYLLVSLAVYLFFSIYKMRDVVKDWRSRAWLPIIQICSDVVVMGGFISGLF